MRRVRKGFSGVETPLFENMLAVRAVDAEEEVRVPTQDDVVQENVIEEVAAEVVPPTPTSPSPPSPQVLKKCFAIVLRVEVEILNLKARVKKLERLNKVKSSKLGRLKKVGISQRIESSEDVENVFNQGRMTVSTRRRKGVVIGDPEEELHDDTPAETPTMKDKGKGILIEDPKPMKKKDQIEMDAEYAKRLQEELEKGHEEAYKKIDWNASFDHVQAKETQYIKRYHGFKKKPQSKSEARKNMISYLKNTEGFNMEFFKGKTYDQILLIFQARFDANLKFLFKTREEIKKEDEEIIKSINETPAQKATKRRKLNEKAQEAGNLRRRLEIVPNEDDDVFVEAVPLTQKAPVMDYQNIDREDLEALWRIVKDRFSSKNPTNFSNEYLLLTLKTMFGELDEQDAIWRNQKSVHGLSLVKRWKLLTSCGVHVIILSTVQLFLLVKRRYPLSRFTLEQLVNVARLQVEEEKGSSHLVQQVLDKCSALVLRVEGLENANAAQQLEIIKLKARVKKLKRLNKGRISVDIETDEWIELEVDQENDAQVEGRHAYTQAEIYNIDLDHSSKVLSMQEDTEVQEAVEVVTTANLITKVVTAAATQVAAASTPIPAAKPKVLKFATPVAAASTPIPAAKPAAKPKVHKFAAAAPVTRRRKGVVIRDPEEELHDDTPAETPTMKDKGKGILIEDPKPMKKKDQIEIDAEYAKKLQEESEKEHDEAYKYHGFKKKPQSESEARKNMISYLKNTEWFKMEFFKGKTYDQILPIFQARFDANMKFLFKSREEMEKEDEEIIKSINETPAQKAKKRRKLNEEAQEADNLRRCLEIVPNEDDDVFVEAVPLA
nr:hypothetical protein [Tanacetum cinerariifolium]